MRAARRVRPAPRYPAQTRRIFRSRDDIAQAEPTPERRLDPARDTSGTSHEPAAIRRRYGRARSLAGRTHRPVHCAASQARERTLWRLTAATARPPPAARYRPAIETDRRATTGPCAT